jgi:DNA invertase Pin-like site-specific DNA recombinase
VLDKRSKFQQVLDDANAGRFGVLIVERMNRLTRAENLSAYHVVDHDLREAGVRLVFVQRQYEDTPTGQLQATLDAWSSGQDQYYRILAIRNGRRGRVNKNKRLLPGN